MEYSLNQLQQFVDSKVWKGYFQVTHKILDYFNCLDLTQSERDNFGSPDFWLFTLGENVFGAEQFEDYYTIEEQTRVNVRRFRTEAISYILFVSETSNI